MTYLPYTNVLIDALNVKQEQKNLLTGLIVQGHRLACCAATVSELFSGIRAADVPSKQLQPSRGVQAAGGTTTLGGA